MCVDARVDSRGSATLFPPVVDRGLNGGGSLRGIVGGGDYQYSCKKLGYWMKSHGRAGKPSARFWRWDVADAVDECGGVEAEAFVVVVAPYRPAGI
jgi:hypothetical protein